MSKQTKTIIGIIIVIAVIVIGYGIYKKSNQPISTESTAIKPASEKVIKIGAILPLSGKYSFIGEYLREGAELAKDEINSKNGINNAKLKIIYGDSQADTKIGLNSYKKLSGVDDIHIFLTTISGVTLGIAPVAEKNKDLIFSVGTASTKISDAGDYIFRHNLLPQTEAQTLAKFIYNKMKIKEIGVLFVNAASGVSYKNAFKKSFKEIGGKIKIIESHEKGATDYRTQLMKIKSSGVKGAVAFSYSNELAIILKQSKELNLDVQWFGIYDAESPKLLEIAQNAADGLIYTHYFDSTFSSPVAKKYNKNYKAIYNRNSESYAALMYDSVNVLAQAIKNCHEPSDTTCIKNELYKIKHFPGVTGDITFDANGDTKKKVIIKTVKNGKFVPYEE